MDSKNTIAAIALSSAVIVLWALFFVPEKSTVDQNIVEKEKMKQSGDAPSLEQKETQIWVERNDNHTHFSISIILDQNETLLLRENYDFFARIWSDKCHPLLHRWDRHTEQNLLLVV